MSSSPPVHYGATASLPYSDYNHEDDYLSVDAEEGRRRRDEEETTPTAPSSSTSSLMRQYQTSGYHSDSAIPTQSHMTPNRRRRTSSREMLDPAAEPLIGTDIDESDREPLLAFAKQFLSRVPPLIEEASETLPARIVSIFRFTLERTEPAKVRVFTPTVDSHGYSAPGSIVEVCTVDSPFLLETV